MNLTVLAFFKYFGFFADSLASAGHRLGLNIGDASLHFLLPVGISFYVFHEISYAVDVYRRRVSAEHDLVTYAVYIAFFPQLVAGPITRASHMLPQFRRERGRPDAESAYSALVLILSGLFKKVVLADGVATIVRDTFSNPTGRGALPLAIGMFAFSIQIYGDFAGYTDIARGVARLLGIDIPRNFEQPYLSRNITEFWRTWHISLSSWLRDYLYVPLGGSQNGEWNTYRNLMITMLLGGLWHGAGLDVRGLGRAARPRVELAPSLREKGRAGEVATADRRRPLADHRHVRARVAALGPVPRLLVLRGAPLLRRLHARIGRPQGRRVEAAIPHRHAVRGDHGRDRPDRPPPAGGQLAEGRPRLDAGRARWAWRSPRSIVWSGAPPVRFIYFQF